MADRYEGGAGGRGSRWYFTLSDHTVNNAYFSIR
jgi:hypothetical protein